MGVYKVPVRINETLMKRASVVESNPASRHHIAGGGGRGGAGGILFDFRLHANPFSRRGLKENNSCESFSTFRRLNSNREVTNIFSTLNSLPSIDKSMRSDNISL